MRFTTYRDDCKNTIMTRIGLIKEGKIPADNRVALTPAQCKWIHKNSYACKDRCTIVGYTVALPTENISRQEWR